MTFQLFTFGALELRADSLAAPIAGAAVQPKPLLILALAALTPGGIPRPRLLSALWPGTDRTRARATLKQHLYALRRATNAPRLLGGAPRLGVDPAIVRVDALEFAVLVDQGRLDEAAALLRGELLEGLAEAPDATPELHRLIAEIREEFRPRVALVRQAAAARRVIAADPVVPVPPPSHAEHDVRAASQRFLRQMAALPDDRVAAYHRAVAASHDVIEGLHLAERAGCSAAKITEWVVDIRAVWQRSPLARRICAAPADRDDPEIVDWLIHGGIRATDPVGHALEWHLLDSPLAVQARARARWSGRRLAETAAVPGSRILFVGCAESAAMTAAVPMLERSEATVCLIDPDEAALELARLRFAALGERVVALGGDPFGRIADLAAQGPFDLILAGTYFDRLPPRTGAWLVPHLLAMLGPTGRLALTSLRRDHPFGPWLRHVAGWDLAERDQNDLLVLLADAASTIEVVWDTASAPSIWRVILRPTAGLSRPRERAA